MHNSLLTRGELTVKIIDCNRLVLPDAAVELYCTASVGNVYRYMYTNIML